MKDIDRLIAQKDAAIAKLTVEIKALKRTRKIVEGVSDTSRATSGRAPKSKRPKRSRKSARAPRGAKKAQVLGVMSVRPEPSI